MFRSTLSQLIFFFFRSISFLFRSVSPSTPSVSFIYVYPRLVPPVLGLSSWAARTRKPTWDGVGMVSCVVVRWSGAVRWSCVAWWSDLCHVRCDGPVLCEGPSMPCEGAICAMKVWGCHAFLAHAMGGCFCPMGARMATIRAMGGPSQDWVRGTVEEAIFEA